MPTRSFAARLAALEAADQAEDRPFTLPQARALLVAALERQEDQPPAEWTEVHAALAQRIEVWCGANH